MLITFLQQKATYIVHAMPDLSHSLKSECSRSHSLHFVDCDIHSSKVCNLESQLEKEKE